MATKKKLSNKQLYAAELLARGMTVTDVAAKIGIGRPQVSLWKNQDKAFIEVVKVAQSDLLKSTRSAVINAHLSALKNIVELMSTGTPSDRRKGVVLFYKHVVSPAEVASINGVTSPTAPEYEDTTLGVLADVMKMIEEGEEEGAYGSDGYDTTHEESLPANAVVV